MPVLEVHVIESYKQYAQETNEDFAKWIRTGIPFVTLKTALTLDGQIAQKAGSVTWITSQQSRDAVQRLRHQADALLTGIGTVLADNPRMTDRTGEPRRRPLLRAIVDSRLRTPLRSHLVQCAQKRRSRVHHAITRFTESSRPDPRRCRSFPRSRAPRPCRSPRRDPRTWPPPDPQRLARSRCRAKRRGARSGIVDKMILFYAPKIMGTGGVPMAGIPSRWFPKSPSLKNLRLTEYGSDFVVEGYFHDVYQQHRKRG